MSEYIPKYPSEEGDDSNKTPSELLAETLKPIYVPQDLMLAWEMHLASYSSDTNALLDQVRDSEADLNTQYQALLTRVQRYEQMLQDITMDSNEFTMGTDEVNFTGWNILAQASYWDYLLRKEITKLSDQIKGAEYKGGLVTEVTDAVLGGLIANNTYISNVIAALSDTPLIRELDAALTSTVTSLSDLQAEYVSLAQKQAADAEALANQQVLNVEQLVADINTSTAEQLDRLAQEAAIRTQLLQELEDRADAMTIEYNAAVDALHTTVIQELNGMQDGITSSVAQLQTADEAIITSLDAYKVSNGQNIAALQSTITTVSNTQESITTQVTGLIASFDQLDIGLSQAQADIVTSNQARADGDEALSQQITTLNSGLGDANSRIDTVSTAVSTLDSATATKFSEVEATLEGVDDSIASVRQIANTAASNDTAQASEITALKSRMTVTEDDVITKADATALSTLETKVANADSALSTRIDSLVANLTSSDGTEINANAFNTLRAEVTTNTGNITTHTSQITALNSSLSSVNTGISANADAVADLRTTVTQQGGAITSHSQAIQQLQSDLDAAEAGLSTKASTTALNTTNTNVSNIAGRVTANTNSLNSLGSRMDTVEGAVTTKLDAAVISNYYTKGQADDKSAEIAAGKIESYDVNLVIGGANLYSGPNPIPMVGQTSEGAHNASSAYSANIQLYKYLENPWFDWQNIAIGDDVITSIEIMVPSGSIVGEHSIYIGTYRLGNNDYLQSARKPLKEFPRDKWVKLSIPAGKFVDTGLTTPEGINISIYLSSCDVGTSFKWRNLMMEKGTKSSTFSESDKTLQFNINANANAIQTVTAEVSRINGEVTSQASSLSLLQSSLSDVDTKANTAINNAASAQQTANTAVTANQANATSLTKLESTFESSRDSESLVADYLMKDVNQWQSIYGYDLSSYFTTVTDGKISNTVFRRPSTIPECWNYSRSSVSNTRKYRLSMWVRCDAASLGNCYFTVMWGNAAYALNPNQYTYEYTGEVPKTNTWTKLEKVWDLTTQDFTQLRFGFAIGHASAGGLWEMQGFKVEAVIGGDDVDGTLATAAALTLTNTEVARVNGEVVATALIAQNLQASLDNTNANISNNYYTRAEADNVVAGKIEKFSSTVLTSGENLFKADILNVDKAYAPGVSGFNYTDYWVIDAASGNSNYISLSLGVSPQIINKNGLYQGAVTVSMDYMIESGSSEVLPSMYFGHGYQAFLHAQDGLHLHGKWYRIYTTFYTDANTLLSYPHFGVGHIAGRICIRNLKIERGSMTTYSADIKETTQSINGIEAIKTITIDNNGVMSGYGLISQLKNGQVTSAFGVNADTFYIGGPALNKKPFLVTSYPQNIDGITYPPGTWINSAIIANATIGSAHIADAAITNAKISTLDAAKITAGIINADRIGAGSITVDKMNVNELSAITATIGHFKSAQSGPRIEIADGFIRVYDESGLVVEIGDLI